VWGGKWGNSKCVKERCVKKGCVGMVKIWDLKGGGGGKVLGNETFYFCLIFVEGLGFLLGLWLLNWMLFKYCT